MKELDGLTEEERRALRGSKFAPLPSAHPPRSQPRLAHPGGPLTTNKAAALAKFLERKLQDPSGLNSINPDLVELAVKNAKESVTASGTSGSGGTIRHVDSLGHSDDSCEERQNSEVKEDKKRKKKNRKKKEEKGKKEKKKQKDVGHARGKKSKKLKF